MTMECVLADDHGSDVATNPFSPASSLHHGSDAMTDLNGALKGCAATSRGVEAEVLATPATTRKQGTQDANCASGHSLQDFFKADDKGSPDAKHTKLEHQKVQENDTGREECGQNGEDGLESADVAGIQGGKALNDRKEKVPFRSSSAVHPAPEAERAQECKHVASSATPTAARKRGTTFAAGHSLQEYLKADDEGSTAVRDSDPQKKVQEKEEVGGGMGQGEAETEGGETAEIQGKRFLSADEECLSVDDGMIQQDSVLGSSSSFQHLPPNGLEDEELVEEQEASKEEGVEDSEGGDEDEGEPVTGGGILGKRGRDDHAIEEEEEVKEEEEEEVFRPGPIRFMLGIPRRVLQRITQWRPWRH